MPNNLTADSINNYVRANSFERLGVLLLDDCASMCDVGSTGNSKASEVNSCVRELIARLQMGRFSRSFYLAIVGFNDAVWVPVPLTAVREMDACADYTPMITGRSGLTEVKAALDMAGEIARMFLEDEEGIPRSAIIIVMTDGGAFGAVDPLMVSALKEALGRIEIGVVGFGPESTTCGPTLGRLATHPWGYSSQYDGSRIDHLFFRQSPNCAAPNI